MRLKVLYLVSEAQLKLELEDAASPVLGVPQGDIQKVAAQENLMRGHNISPS